MNRGKKSSIKIFLIVVFILIVVGIAISTVLGEKIRFIWNAYSAYSEKKEMSSEELESVQESNDNKTKEILNELTTTEIHDLTDEEKEALAKGELSEEEALKIILGEDAEDAESAKHSETESASDTGDKKTDKSDVATEKTLDKEQISEMKDIIIAKVYILRASFINQIETLINDKVNEYKALPLEEHGTLKKAEYAKKLVDEGSVLEKECDAEFEALLDELKALLTMEGSDFSLIDEIRESYEEQKRIKKAEILKQYMN